MTNIAPFLVLGVALGGVFALNSVGIVLLHRATGVLNFAGGATGAFGALVAWSLVNELNVNEWVAFGAGILAATLVTFLFGVMIARRLSQREPIVKAISTLGLLLVLLGLMSWFWPASLTRSLPLPTSGWRISLGDAFVSGTQLLCVALAIVVTLGTSLFLSHTRMGTAMRALADDREIASMLGVPVRRVEAVAWLVSGALAGVTGILLSNLVNLAASELTFLIVPALAVALAARLESVNVSLLMGLVIGVVQALLTPFPGISEYRTMTPFIVATLAVLWLSWRRPELGRV